MRIQERDVDLHADNSSRSLRGAFDLRNDASPSFRSAHCPSVEEGQQLVHPLLIVIVDWVSAEAARTIKSAYLGDLRLGSSEDRFSPSCQGRSCLTDIRHVARQFHFNEEEKPVLGDLGPFLDT